MFSGCATKDASTRPPSPAVSIPSDAHVPCSTWRVASVAEHGRPHRPEGLSGITKVEGASFLSIEDRGGRLWTLNVSLDAAGRVAGCAIPAHVVLEGVVDGEGCAWDSLRKTVWVSDEVGPHVSEHDVATGKRLGELTLTDDFKKIRTNLGPEGLTISPDGLTLWTCPEETVADDGATASPTNGALVHLHRYVRVAGTDPWRAVEAVPYRTDPMGGRPYRNIRSSGVAGLCALSDGTLLVLEREMSIKDRILPLPSFRLRLYSVSAGAPKHLILSRDTGIANYEGVCLVSETSSRVRLLLVSDGEGLASEMLMSVDLVR